MELAIQAEQQLLLSARMASTTPAGAGRRWRLGRRAEAQRAGRQTERLLGCEHVLDGRGGDATLLPRDRTVTHTDSLGERTLAQTVSNAARR
jgi:hypothetical protein